MRPRRLTALYVFFTGVSRMVQKMREMRGNNKFAYTSEEQVKSERTQIIDLAMNHGVAIKVSSHFWTTHIIQDHNVILKRILLLFWIVLKL